MLSISDEDLDFMTNFSALNIVPVAISYEYDPTDSMKIPQLMANMEGKTYTKKKKRETRHKQEMSERVCLNLPKFLTPCRLLYIP